MILLAPVQINGFFVHEDQGARKIDLPDDVRLTSDVNNHEIVAGDRTQADRIGRVGFVCPVVIFSGKIEETGFREPRAKIRKVRVAKFLSGRDRQFKRRAFQMIDKNFQIVRLDERVLRRAAKEIVGMSHHELIEERGRSNQHGARASIPPARASGTLPSGGNRPGITGHHDGVARPDVHAGRLAHSGLFPAAGSAR